MIKKLLAILAILTAFSVGAQQTLTSPILINPQIQNGRSTGNGLGLPTGTSLPASCAVGMLFFKTDATAGSNIYECASTNTWTQQAGGPGGSGTVTSFSCVTANGVSCSVANASTTPAATFTLGAITPTTVNGNTFTTGSSTYTGTAGQTYTFPSVTSTLAPTASPTFTGTITGAAATLSSTLGVTGLTTLSGRLSITGGAGDGFDVTPTVGTNGAYGKYVNTGGTLFVGMDGSTGGGFGTAGNYGTVIFRPASTAFAISRSTTVDLAVSSTGAITIPGTLDVGGKIGQTCTTVVGLPAGSTGDRHCVTDATACVFQTAPTGGGSVVCPVFKNATAWVGG